MPRVGSFVLADRQTRNEQVKTVDGEPMIHIATQVPKRQRHRGRGKRTWYIFWHRHSRKVYRASQRDSWVYLQMGHDDEDARRYYATFVEAPLTRPELDWLHRNNYNLIGDRRWQQK